jgi:cytochrome b561
MATLHQPTVSYDALSKAFHWTTVALVVAVFVLAIAPGLVEGSMTLHKSLGILLMGVMIARLCWRLTRFSVSWLHEHKSAAEIAAFAVHQGFYSLMIAIPLLGWAYLGYKGQELQAFGHALPPLITGSSRATAALLLELKKYLAYLALGLIGLHASAALFHHYVVRDGVLRSMLPFARHRALEAAAGFGFVQQSASPTAAE